VETCVKLCLTFDIQHLQKLHTQKVEVRTKTAHIKCASPDTTRPTALKTDSNFTSGMTKIGAKRVQNGSSIIKGHKLENAHRFTKLRKMGQCF